MEIVKFQGEEYPSNFRFRSDYEKMDPDQIPEGALIGIALSFMVANDGSDNLIYPNTPLYWEQGGISSPGKKK